MYAGLQFGRGARTRWEESWGVAQLGFLAKSNGICDMTPQEVIDQALIPGTHSVLVLGCYEQRVTVYAQQVRALNLVDALLARKLVRPDGKIAIVGGGAAGITAAVALAKAAPELKAIDVYERDSRILPLQHGSKRFLHPHFYDWPTPGADQRDAGLPIMNWQAGHASDVAIALSREFQKAQQNPSLKLHLGRRIEKLSPSTLAGVRLVAESPGSAPPSQLYDVVILAVGFGVERYLFGETWSYWSPSSLTGTVIATTNQTLFVSGNGDGGLVDFLTASFDAMDHHRICDLFLGLDLGAALGEINDIEKEAWAAATPVDLYDAYRTRVRSKIPKAAWHTITDSLRQNVLIRFHTRESLLLRRETALHNRILTFLVLEADKDHRNAITTIVGAEFEGDVPTHGEVRVKGEPPFTPDRRILRLGPDGNENLAPFHDVLENYPGRAKPKSAGVQPSSPKLTSEAQQRFEKVRLATLAAPATVKTTAVPATTACFTIVLTAGAGGTVRWDGDLAPDAIGDLWASNPSLSIFCDVSAADASSLVPTLARVGAHVHNFVLHARDIAGWRSSLEALCAARTLPGPNVDLRCRIQDWASPPPVPHVTEALSADLSDRIREKLDDECLRQLNEALFGILGPAAVPMGWRIEQTLRTKLWKEWEQWRAVLSANKPACQRFMRLLATEFDQEMADDTALVRLGPKTVRPHLTNAAIFALTFSVCSGSAVSPATRHPGNLGVDTLTGHSCGVGWINERLLGMSGARELPWTTNIVLLSELRERFRMIEGELRMDASFGDAGRLGMIAATELPLIIGADPDFLHALEAGEPVVQAHLREIFAWRARAAGETIEEVAP